MISHVGSGMICVFFFAEFAPDLSMLNLFLILLLCVGFGLFYELSEYISDKYADYYDLDFDLPNAKFDIRNNIVGNIIGILLLIIFF